jgi:hypothetical protein
VADKVEVNLEQNSPYRVSLELAYTIARAEGKLTAAMTSGDKKYWLELYQSCRRVVLSGDTAANALKSIGQ